MGAYLTTPSVNKVSSNEEGDRVAYGASSMQGWRMSQEDAHNCCINFDQDTSLFAVYDGHGGDEVSTYCSQHLPEFLKNTEAYKNGDVKQALIDAFLGFDASLTTPEIIKVLKEIAKDDQNDSENEEDNVARLRMEANMPIEEVLSKYKTEIEDHIIKRSPHLAYIRENKNTGEASSSGASSSGITGSSSSKSKSSVAGSSSNACSSSAAGSSSGAGSTSGVGSSSSDGSSRRLENNDSNVSSSSQQCVSASSSGSQNKTEAPNSSEADQILDSTTSNGDATSASQVDSSADAKLVKASEMPDSSEDANEKVSPSKVTNSTPAPSEAEVNGEVNNVETADSSKNVNDNECSSSCSALPVENGEAEQQENISSSGFKSNQNSELYKNFINSDSSDSDSDDDNYEHTDFGYDDEEEDPDNEDDSAESDNDENDEELADDDDVQDIPADEEEEDDDEEEDDEVDIREPTDEPGVDSGCTAVVAVLKGDELYVANAGDSRCVLCRDGEAVELSLDHKPEDQIEMDRIVKAGGKVTSDGRVNGGLNLSRALGDHAYKKSKDLPAQEQMISAMPDIKTVTIDREKDEFMVLACDGIWNSMSSQRVINFVRERINDPERSLSKICEELFDNCLAPNTLGDGTGCDNMTAIIVKFKSLKVEKEASSTDALLEKKKRPASPNTENNGSEDTTEENTVDSNKRMKMNEC